MVLWLWGRKSIFCNEIKCYSIQSWPKYLGHYDILNQFCCFYHSDTPPPVQCWNFPNFYSPMFLDATLIGGKGGIQIRNLTFLTACETGRVPNPKICRGGPRTFGQDCKIKTLPHVPDDCTLLRYFLLSSPDPHSRVCRNETIIIYIKKMQTKRRIVSKGVIFLTWPYICGIQRWRQEFPDTGAKVLDMGAKLGGIRGHAPPPKCHNLSLKWRLPRFQRHIITTADKPQHLF